MCLIEYFSNTFYQESALRYVTAKLLVLNEEIELFIQPENN